MSKASAESLRGNFRRAGVGLKEKRHLILLYPTYWKKSIFLLERRAPTRLNLAGKFDSVGNPV